MAVALHARLSRCCDNAAADHGIVPDRHQRSTALLAKCALPAVAPSTLLLMLRANCRALQRAQHIA